ncbi:MAG: hypothetical protein JJU33_06325 [Phycisphaerales bacterium]|nr:hypothetical protein [Phycisphaerales bacterium]
MEKQLGWTVIACPVCRGVERAPVLEDHELGMLMGLLPKRGRAINVLRCEGCGVEMVPRSIECVHTARNLSAEDMLAMEAPDEAERIVAAADLFERAAAGEVDTDERSDAIALACDALAHESWIVNRDVTIRMTCYGSFVGVVMLIVGLAPRTGGQIDRLVIMLTFVAAVVIWGALFWWMSEIRHARRRKRLPGVLRPLDPSVEELRAALELADRGGSLRIRPRRYARQLHEDIQRVKSKPNSGG